MILNQPGMVEGVGLTIKQLLSLAEQAHTPDSSQGREEGSRELSSTHDPEGTPLTSASESSSSVQMPIAGGRCTSILPKTIAARDRQLSCLYAAGSSYPAESSAREQAAILPEPDAMLVEERVSIPAKVARMPTLNKIFPEDFWFAGG